MKVHVNSKVTNPSVEKYKQPLFFASEKKGRIQKKARKYTDWLLSLIRKLRITTYLVLEHGHRS